MIDPMNRINSTNTGRKPQMRIEDSALPFLGEASLDILRDAKSHEDTVLVTGQPINMWGAEGDDKAFDECQGLYRLPFVVRCVSLVFLPRTGHEHIPKRYTPEHAYAALLGFDERGNEYRMGILDTLGFEIYPAIT
jgi:hypothetical protein